MQKLNGETLNIVDTNIEKLKELFPDVFSEGKIDFDALKTNLGDFVEKENERYSFTWNGKEKAKKIALTPSTGTLRPCKEDSKDWETTENLYIEGDNLEVLKLLQKSYFEKVKMIYIDPPYNTGKDFVYKDNFNDNLKNYMEVTGQLGEEGEKLSTNSDQSGRYHSNWLNMMYPRLKLARNLLKDDGVIFISIGEQEVDNLRKICDEIFGDGNFIGEAGRISKKANNQGDYWAPNFDYLLTYCKNLEFCSPFFGGINYKAYKEIEEKGERRGEKYQLIRLYMTSLDPMRGCNNQRYYIECPDGSFVIPPGNNFPENISDGAKIEPKSGADKVWRWSVSSYLEKKDVLYFKRVKSSNLVDENGNPAKWNVFTKTYLNDVISKSSASPNNFIENHLNQSSSHELKKLDIPFDFAKPSSLIEFLSETCRVGKFDIVLDFFSGSATTAHAVLKLNTKDNGNRKYIMIQLPEITSEKEDAFKEGFKNICEIGKERIRRAGDKIKKEFLEANENLKLGEEAKEFNTDIGFKVFKLDSSNIKAWDSEYAKDNIQKSLMESVDNIKEDRTELDLLFELLLKQGLDLTTPIMETKVNDKVIYNIGAGALYVSLSNNISVDVADKIIEENKTYNSPRVTVIFKDNGFANDVDKTNVIQTLKVAGITDIKSI